MRAMICREFGPPESLVLGELPTQALGENDIRVRVHAASVNFPDTLIMQGKYQLKPPLPFAPGFEVAGEAIEVGAAVTRYRVGDRLMGLTSSGYGGFADEAVTDVTRAVAVPDDMDYVTATAFYVAYGTSYHALVQRGQLRSGEVLVVLGASGGVGLAAVEIGKALGAQVLAAASTEDKLEITREHGADETINYQTEDLRERIKALTGGKGADVCFDAVGGDQFDAASRSMNFNGRLLVVGFTSGRIPRLPTNLLLLKSYQAVGVYFNNLVLRDPETNQANFRHLCQLFSEGALRPRIFRTYPLEQAASALNDVLARRVTGKLVLTLS